MMMRLDFSLSLSLLYCNEIHEMEGKNFLHFLFFFQNWSYSIDQLARGIRTRCVLALISSSVCLFKLAYPIFLFIESIRLVLFLRSRDMIMEQVKQTFRFSPSWQLLRLNQFLRQEIFPFLSLIKLMQERMRIDVVLFQDFIIVRSVELLFFQFQVLRKQSEAKEWIVIIWRVVHYENVERVLLISTVTSFFFRRRQ